MREMRKCRDTTERRVDLTGKLGVPALTVCRGISTVRAVSIDKSNQAQEKTCKGHNHCQVERVYAIHLAELCADEADT